MTVLGVVFAAAAIAKWLSGGEVGWLILAVLVSVALLLPRRGRP